MKSSVLGLLVLALAAPAAALADDAPPSTDVFSYSTLQLDRQHAHSDFFGDSSAGNGLKFSYDFADEVYLFGQWNKLDFDARPGSHSLTGIGVGAHQAYSTQTSFYIDLAFMQDRLDSAGGGATDDYWRISYGFRTHANGLLEYSGAIFTERNTLFGRRPFGERVGLGLNFAVFSVQAGVEHTSDGNRTELALVWAYR
jgi:opacity protein-like surface antigen